MIPRSNLKFSQLRKKRRKILIGRIVILSILCFLVLGGLVWISRIEPINISTINISGAISTKPGDIISTTKNILSGTYAYLFPKTNFFLYPKGDIKDAIIANFPRVKGVDIKFVNLTAIGISLEERIPLALWCQGAPRLIEEDVNDGCYLIDDSGFIFASSTEPMTQDLFRFYGSIESAEPIGADYLSDKDLFRRIQSFVGSLSQNNIQTTSLLRKPDGDIDIFMKTGGRIVFNEKQNLEIVLQNINSVFSSPEFSVATKTNTQSIDYIDVRFGNKVFYKKR